MRLERLKKDLDLLVDCGRYPKLYGKAIEKKVKARVLAAFKARQGSLFASSEGE